MVSVLRRVRSCRFIAIIFYTPGSIDPRGYKLKKTKTRLEWLRVDFTFSLEGLTEENGVIIIILFCFFLFLYFGRSSRDGRQKLILEIITLMVNHHIIIFYFYF